MEMLTELLCVMKKVVIIDGDQIIACNSNEMEKKKNVKRRCGWHFNV